MHAPRKHLPPQRRQRGLTLVELMVGLALGLVVVAALLLLFANASSNGQNLARAGMQIENGRYVSELLREDLRLAGFFGETAIGGAVYEDPDPCSTTPTGWSGSPFTLPSPVQGHTPAQALSCLTDRLPGTAAITVRRLGIDSIDPATIVAGGTQYYVQYSYCIDDISTPRLLFDTDPTQLTLRNRACNSPNRVRPYVSRIYYIARCNRCDGDGGGDGIPTLKRVDLVGQSLVTTPLAEGIEQLRVEYGFDEDANGSADTYLETLGATGPTAAWANVMTLKVHFISRSLEKAVGAQLATDQTFQLGGTAALTTAADGYTRRAYSSVIRLINPSSAREFQ